MNQYPSTREARREFFRRGYADGLAGRPMAIDWNRSGIVAHSYGMGYFHGRAHR